MSDSSCLIEPFDNPVNAQLHHNEHGDQVETKMVGSLTTGTDNETKNTVTLSCLGTQCRLSAELQGQRISFESRCVFCVDKEYEMSNAEFGAYQDMLRQCEESMFGGDVQDDDETEQECE